MKEEEISNDNLIMEGNKIEKKSKSREGMDHMKK